jgi:SprT protein
LIVCAAALHIQTPFCSHRPRCSLLEFRYGSTERSGERQGFEDENSRRLQRGPRGAASTPNTVGGWTEHGCRQAVMGTIQPIGGRERRSITVATARCIARANGLLDARCADIPVHFDLKGRAAGMYRIVRGQRIIRYNPYLFAKYFDENLNTTVPHEVAHYLTDMVYGYPKVKPHGHEWRTIMRMLGADASIHCEFDLDGIPVRRYRRVRYACRCRFHELTRVRHNRIQAKGARYFCQTCRAELVPAPDE